MLKKDLEPGANIEAILTRARALADTIGGSHIHGLDGPGFGVLADALCSGVGELVKVPLPVGQTPFTELAAWIGGTSRAHAVEVFTTNYDLLFESAFERLRIPYFDGFVGSRDPFFDPVAVAYDQLPARWSRLRKLHGSLGWDAGEAGVFIRGRGTSATRLIYPTHLKYDQTQKLPYMAFMERLRAFVYNPDSLLVCCGFSFADAHLRAVVDEALSASPSSAVVVLHFGPMTHAVHSREVASRRPNLSVYARDAAVVAGTEAPWRLGDLPQEGWESIRATYWGTSRDGDEEGFLLGDFRQLAHYVTQTRVYHVDSIAGDRLARAAGPV